MLCDVLRPKKHSAKDWPFSSVAYFADLTFVCLNHILIHMFQTSDDSWLLFWCWFVTGHWATFGYDCARTKRAKWCRPNPGRSSRCPLERVSDRVSDRGDVVARREIISCREISSTELGLSWGFLKFICIGLKIYRAKKKTGRAGDNGALVRMSLSTGSMIAETSTGTLRLEMCGSMSIEMYWDVLRALTLAMSATLEVVPWESCGIYPAVFWSRSQTAAVAIGFGSLMYSPAWYQDRAVFSDQSAHQKIIKSWGKL